MTEKPRSLNFSNKVGVAIRRGSVGINRSRAKSRSSVSFASDIEILKVCLRARIAASNTAIVSSHDITAPSHKCSSEGNASSLELIRRGGPAPARLVGCAVTPYRAKQAREELNATSAGAQPPSLHECNRKNCSSRAFSISRCEAGTCFSDSFPHLGHWANQSRPMTSASLSGIVVFVQEQRLHMKVKGWGCLGISNARN